MIAASFACYVGMLCPGHTTFHCVSGGWVPCSFTRAPFLQWISPCSEWNVVMYAFLVRVLFAFLHRYIAATSSVRHHSFINPLPRLGRIGGLCNATYATRYLFCMQSGCYSLLVLHVVWVFLLTCFCLGKSGRRSLPYIVLRVLLSIARIQLRECCV